MEAGLVYMEVDTLPELIEGEEALFLAGDTHGTIYHWRYLMDVALDHGIKKIFQLGDFGYWEHMTQGRRYLDQLQQMADEDDLYVYFLDGNHDKTSLLLRRYRDQADEEGFLRVRDRVLYSPRGHRWTWNGTTFISLGGAYSIDKQWRLDREFWNQRPESLWFPEEEMTDNDMDMIIMSDSSPVDVMLAHDKPYSSKPDWNRKALPLCIPNQLRLQRAVNVLQPKLFAHGHLHYRYSDLINETTIVEGLSCDTEAAPEEWLYDRKDSHLILSYINGSLVHSTLLPEEAA